MSGDILLSCHEPFVVVDVFHDGEIYQCVVRDYCRIPVDVLQTSVNFIDSVHQL